MKVGLTLAALLAFAAAPALAGDIYKWVDETGRTQLSDSVPEKYKKSATRVDGSRYELTAQERAESSARLEKERAADAAKRKASAQTAAPSAAASASIVSSKQKSEADTKTDCETLRRLYRESQDCFAPYVTTGGATKAEGFQRCTPVLDPTAKCGAPKAY